MYKHIVLIWLLITAQSYADTAPHKIIYLISPPRSLSTLFLRMMHNRGDFLVMNEPAQYASVKNVHPQFAQTHHIS